VYNPTVKSALGHHPAYMIVPAENSGTFLQPESSTLKRAGFVKHHLWVTPFKPEEMNAAGAYPNQSPGGEGLPKWTADDEPVTKTDVVLWYTVGLTHVPRPEEWPIMPAAGVGFKLMPAGFFTRNPALDLPGGEEAKEGK
jgi:primary-amine oxidase